MGRRHVADCLVSPVDHPSTVPYLIDLAKGQTANSEGLFYLEGVRSLFCAVQQSVTIKRLIVSPELLISDAGRRLVKQLRIAGATCSRLTADEFRTVSQVHEPQGLAAVVQQRWSNLRSIESGAGLCWLALDSIRSGGNLGTIIRTGDAVGAEGIVLIGDSVDPYNQTTARAAMGSLFSLRFVRASRSEFIKWKRSSNVELVGTSISAKRAYKEYRYSTRTMILMGCERKGICPELASICDSIVTIPMVGATDSLNVGVAAGIVLYELFYQRHCNRQIS